MHDDDTPVGRILSRREVIALLGATGAGLAAAKAGAQLTGTYAKTSSPGGQAFGAAGGGRAQVSGAPVGLYQAPACVVRPQQTEGPYFVDAKLDRTDIRSDPGTGVVSAGVPLALDFRVFRVGAGSCTPLAGAIVDIWQCDADGIYSDVRDMNNLFNTIGKKFLRGFQKTDAGGVAKFATIYPGWYQGRAVHIHFKIRSSAGTRAHEFTSQLYFDDALNAKVFALAPYSIKGVKGLVLNGRDGIFRNGGQQLLVDLKPQGAGYVGAFEIGLNIA